MLALTLTVTAWGVLQQSRLLGETDSQFPPELAMGVNPTAELLLVSMVKICVGGFAPPNGMVKLIGFTCSKTTVPTVTLTGMLVMSPAVSKSNSPR